jgi:hypothetical protein
MSIVNAKYNWLDEERITASSYPYLAVTFGQKGEIETASTGTAGSSAQQYENFTVYSTFADNKAGGGIVDAEFEGMVAGARNGSVRIVDPNGVYMDALQKIASQNNNFLGGATGPTIWITFGWKSLSLGPGVSSAGKTRDFLSTIDGLITGVEFDMSDEGVITANVKFFEYAASTIDLVKFVAVADMQIGNVRNLYDQNNSGYDDRLPQHLMTYILKPASTSAGKFLDDKKIQIIFLGANDTKEIAKDRWPNVRFGSALTSWINEVTSIMERKDSNQQNTGSTSTSKSQADQFIYSYEKIGTAFLGEDQSSMHDMIVGRLNDNRIKMVAGYKYVVYDWKASKEETQDTQNDHDPTPPDIQFWQGPTLVYKGLQKKAGQKTILNWSSDLSSHTALVFQFGTDLDRKMKNFTEDDWKNFETIMTKGWITTTGQNGPTLTANTTVAAVRDKFSGVDEQAALRMVNDLYSEQKEAEKSSATANQFTQLRAVIRNNAFKATATIMGDPAIGTTFSGGSTILPTNFLPLSQYANDLFGRSWIQLKTVHKFEAGKYTTDIEMLSYMPVNNNAVPANAAPMRLINAT